MKKQNIAMVLGAVFAVMASCSVASAQGERVPVDTGLTIDGIRLMSIPQDAPNDALLATKIVFESVDPVATDVVTFDGLQITGSLHQVWFPGRNPIPTPTLEDYAGEAGFFDSWLPYDSKVLLNLSNIGGQVGGGFVGLAESNDQSDAAGQNALIPLVPGEPDGPITGIGDITTQNPTDAFFINDTVDKDSVEFAYLVVPKDAVDAEGYGAAFLSLGLLGDGFGPNSYQQVDIQFVPEPTTAIAAGFFGLAALMYRRRRNR